MVCSFILLQNLFLLFIDDITNTFPLLCVLILGLYPKPMPSWLVHFWISVGVSLVLFLLLWTSQLHLLVSRKKWKWFLLISSLFHRTKKEKNIFFFSFMGLPFIMYIFFFFMFFVDSIRFSIRVEEESQHSMSFGRFFLWGEGRLYSMPKARTLIIDYPPKWVV